MAPTDRRPVRSASAATRLEQLALTRPDLGLVVERAATAPPALDVLAANPARIAAWLSRTASIAEGIDERTAAAYLISIFTWRFGEVLALLYLDGTALPRLSAREVSVDLHTGSDASTRDIFFRIDLRFDEVGTAFDSNAMRDSIVAIHAPLVAALYEHTGLSQNALWRLVTDGMAGGWLAAAETGDREPYGARAAAESILSMPPLSNRQWRFVQVTAGSRHRWYRLRGGCCRLYKSAGGTKCTTCVLRHPDDQLQRLQAHLARSD